MTPNRKPSVSGFIRALLYVGAAFLLALYLALLLNDPRAMLAGLWS